MYVHVCVQAIIGCSQSTLSLLMWSKRVINLGWSVAIDSIREKIMTPDRGWVTDYLFIMEPGLINEYFVLNIDVLDASRFE